MPNNHAPMSDQINKHHHRRRINNSPNRTHPTPRAHLRRPSRPRSFNSSPEGARARPLPAAVRDGGGTPGAGSESPPAASGARSGRRRSITTAAAAAVFTCASKFREFYGFGLGGLPGCGRGARRPFGGFGPCTILIRYC